MRGRLLWGAVAAIALLAATPAQSGKLKFSPTAFQVYGGMGNGQAAPSRLKRLQWSTAHEAILHKTIAFPSSYAPGTVIVRTGTRRLYYVLSSSEAIEYHVGVGREGYQWSGTNRISGKAEWPDWRPPTEMIRREANRGHPIPEFVRGGPDNPLGARAIYIGNTQYRIHGTTQPWSIGRAVSSGCIRMMNEEVIDLYDRVKVGAQVIVQ